jgi:hypothetical protein
MDKVQENNFADYHKSTVVGTKPCVPCPLEVVRGLEEWEGFVARCLSSCVGVPLFTSYPQVSYSRNAQFGPDYCTIWAAVAQVV